MILDDDILGRGARTWWKLPIGIFLIAGFVYLLLLPFRLLLEGISLLIYGTKIPFSDAFSTFTLFFSFLPIFFAVVATVFLLYRRSLFSLIHPLKSKIWPQIRPALLFVLLSTAVYTIYIFAISPLFIHLFDWVEPPAEYIWKPKLWAAWLLPMMVFILIQSSTEEIIMRGFLQQYLAALIPIAWVYYLIPAAIFAALHWWNFTDIRLQIVAVFSIFIQALIWADWAARSKSLIGPITLHFLGNFSAVMLIGMSAEPSPFHIVQYQINLDEYSNAQIITDLMISTLLTVFCYLIIRPLIPQETPQQKHRPDF